MLPLCMRYYFKVILTRQPILSQLFTTPFHGSQLRFLLMEDQVKAGSDVKLTSDELWPLLVTVVLLAGRLKALGYC